MSDLVVSWIRTIIPTLVGAIGAFLTQKGVEVSPEDLAGLTAFLTAVISGVYYVIARILEKKYPRAGYLLGSPKQPTYEEEL